MLRIPELDALRGLAALTVLHYHFAHLMKFNRSVYEGGWAAVDLFFVLSGYLITSIVLENINSPSFFLNFYARRALRIWPLYYLALATVLALNALAHFPIPTAAGLPWHLVFLQNVQYYWHVYPPEFDWHFMHSWTLALEEQFYIVWPVILFILGPGRVQVLCPIVVTISAVFLFSEFHPWLLVSRCGGFAMGGWLAAIFRPPIANSNAVRRASLARSVWLAIALVVPLAYLLWGRVTHGAIFFKDRASTVLASTTMFTGVVGLVIAYSGQPFLGLLRLRALRYLGKISFGVYIWHLSLFGVFNVVLSQARIDSPLLRYGCYYVLTLLVAVVSWHLFESPILRLKDRFSYRQGEPVGFPPARKPLGDRY